MSRRATRTHSLAKAAACGAAAGLVGGVTLTALDRLVIPRLGNAMHGERDWDKGVAHAMARLGVRVSRRGRATAGIVAGLVYAALVGTGYGVARERWQSSPATLKLLDAMLIYAAALVSPDARRRRPKLPHRPARALAIGAVSSGALFGRATAATYRALARRVG